MYYEENLPIVNKDNLCTLRNFQLQKSQSAKNLYADLCLYRSRIQTKKEFEEFCIDLKLLLSNVSNVNILLSVITGDFNARSSNWQSLDKDNAERQKIIFLTSACGYSQKN